MSTKDPAKADSAEEATQAKAASSPHPDDSRKPDDPTDIAKPAWGYIFKRTINEFSKDQCTDLAAALTYYAVLAIFPALLALVSILGLFGQGQATTDAVLNILSSVSPDAEQTLEPTVQQLTSSSAAGFTFIIGLVGAIWSASGFVGAFSRAMNRMYEVEEGRPFWKLRPTMLLITVVVLLLVVLMALLLILSGPIAESVGNAIGLGSTAVTIWNIAKWPVMVFFAVLMIAVLYYAAPNLKQPKFKWVSIGSIIALVVLALTTAAFSFYVANFGNYERTYGAIAGVIIFLLWLWLANLSLLFGAEFDAELERGRELQAGIKAEETVQLPPRDTKQADKKRDKHIELVDRGRELRNEYGRDKANR
ncbi:YihY family inner membrane protein [Arthrobacter sp. JZ12]|uniref:YihY/virulence factor BrkB family protein n=1 Tax=Arthrobacter sp. JZ12 TaxID=2654190 RepID=UPI002B492A96|nr:YihY/virulence factor BrkB family protein [Arthrobacter sp. JZ12]WRH25917.1 YihY family inner membrane protein [Arthrobacter sp. JZ12]